jgi:hypothetical protein
MRRHIILGFQFGRQFRHRDIRLRLDPLEQSRQMRRQFTSPRRTTLPRWPGRTRPRYQIRQLYCKACADIVPPRRRPARLTAIDLRLNPFPKINRIRLPHPCWPPSIPASILNQTSDSLGIPFRFLFHARRSRSCRSAGLQARSCHRINDEDADAVGVTPDLRRSAVRQDA